MEVCSRSKCFRYYRETFNRFYNFDNRLETYLSLESGNTIDNFQPTDPEAEQIPETVLYVAHSNDYRWFLVSSTEQQKVNEIYQITKDAHHLTTDHSHLIINKCITFINYFY